MYSAPSTVTVSGTTSMPYRCASDAGSCEFESVQMPIMLPPGTGRR
jgi:hypothetical protein